MKHENITKLIVSIKRLGIKVLGGYGRSNV